MIIQTKQNGVCICWNEMNVDTRPARPHYLCRKLATVSRGHSASKMIGKCVGLAEHSLVQYCSQNSVTFWPLWSTDIRVLDW